MLTVYGFTCILPDDMSITIKTRDSEETVPAKLLTDNSAVFTRLIIELGFTEVEIEDFDPDIVRIFLTLIEETELDDIERNQFRDLHKLSVSFEIKWLTRRCRYWLGDLIQNFGGGSTFADYLYIFNESLFIQNVMKYDYFTDSLIEKREKYNLARFIPFHLAHLDQDVQNVRGLDTILRLCAGRTFFILKALICRINKDQKLSKNSRYLLSNMNLPLCFEMNRELYHTLFDNLSKLPNLDNDDLRLILKLSTESVRQSFQRDQFVPQSTELFNNFALERREETYETLDDILKMVETGEVLNMFGVLDLLVKVTALHPPDVEEAQQFVHGLEKLFLDAPTKRASHHFTDMMITAMTSSNQPQKFKAVMLLEMIRDSEVLVSKHEHILVNLSENEIIMSALRGLSSPIIKILHYLIRKTPIPALTNAALDQLAILEVRMGKVGNCGFKIKIAQKNGDQGCFEVCTEDEVYKDSDTHYHKLISAEKMHFYFVVSGPTPDGIQFKVPNQMMGRWSKWWFTENHNHSFFSDKFAEMYLEWNVRDFLVIQ